MNVSIRQARIVDPEQQWVAYLYTGRALVFVANDVLLWEQATRGRARIDELIAWLRRRVPDVQWAPVDSERVQRYFTASKWPLSFLKSDRELVQA